MRLSRGNRFVELKHVALKPKLLVLCATLILLSTSSHAQDRNWTLTGYVKDLFMYYHPKQIPGFPIDNQYTNTIHNRLNFCLVSDR